MDTQVIDATEQTFDEEPALASRYDVMSIPAIVLFKDGEPAAATLGAQPKTAIERALGL